MATEKRLIDLDVAIERAMKSDNIVGSSIWETSEAVMFLEDEPIVDAVEVVHGRWEKEGGDLHSSGYAVRCSVCNDVYFVHHKFALGALTAEVLFKKPKYCPNCGAKMDGDENG